MAGKDAVAVTRNAVRRQRWRLVARIHRALEPIFIVLSVVWIVLVVVELAGRALTPALDRTVWVIWGLFVVEFAVGLLIAPARVAYVRKHWLTALSLVLPAFRVLRIASLVRVVSATRLTRSVGLLRILTSVNRGLGALGRTASKRGVGYVTAATAIVLTVGAGGMAYFEGTAALGVAPAGEGLRLETYGDALWWTAYAMTTGAFSEPLTTEGRLLGWILSVYGLAVFGYLTAILASHFIGRDISGRPLAPPA